MGGRRRKSRKMRGGMGYGFGGTIGTAGPVWDSSWGGEVTKAGAPVYDTAAPQRGSSRRRRSRGRKMRGGDDEHGAQLVEAIVSQTEMTEEEADAAEKIQVMPRSEAIEKGYKILRVAPPPSVARAMEVNGVPSGASRRRKSKKGGRKSRKSRRKTMRGGAGWQSVGAVGAAFNGTGSRGMQDYVPYASKVPPAGGPTQNPDGAYRA